MKNLRVLCAVMFILLIGLAASFAQGQDKVLLQFKGEQGKILKYKFDVGGVMNLDLKELPMPGAKMTADNLTAKVGILTYLDTVSVEEGKIVFNVTGTIDKLSLGDLLQIEGLLGQAGVPSISAKLTLTPLGKVEDVEMESAKEGKGGESKAGGILSGLGIDLGDIGPETLLPMVIDMIPALFPEKPVGVGDTWTQAMATEDASIPFLPKVEFNFKLDAVDKDVAVISFTSAGTFDASFLKNFLAMIPEIPMGENVMTIDDIKLVIPWDMKGTMRFNIAEGKVESATAHHIYNIDGGASIKFKKPDKTKTAWLPKLTIKVEADTGAKFEGYGTREELDSLIKQGTKEEETTTE